MAILARIITGFGSSGMLDLSSVLLNDIGGSFGVAVLRSYFMIVMMIGYSGGGALGGFLATLVGWRCSFLLHVPIVFLCALVTVLQLPKDTHEDPQPSTILDDNNGDEEEKASRPGNMDTLGIFLLVCAILSALMMVQVLQGDILPEITDYLSTGLGTASLLLLGIFCVHEVRWANRPLVPISFMMSSQTGLVCVLQILATIADFALSSTLSEYFVRTKNFSMTAASACLVPSALGGALGGYLAGRYMQKLTQLGLCLCIASCILITIRWCFFNPSLWELVYDFGHGVGLGILFSTQFVALSAHSPKDYVARLITTYYLMQQIGTVVGVSVTAWLVRSNFANALQTKFAGNPQGMTR
ncbi:hypothetical protein N7454_009727 [Penicillium verhagenii]|nr:hypothetical protein N7454_009727 [Penicillium verhagenii]